jgi:DNA primase catalytic subunit
MSAMNWLCPERVGPKRKANHAYPVRGEYVVDIDNYLQSKIHVHHRSFNDVCVECLESSKQTTIQVCESIEEYYTDISVVFSGKSGFHVHVFDFELRDWTFYDAKNPVKSHEIARFKFTKTLSFDLPVFDQHHFPVSVDPMRIMSVPKTLNGETGLVCTFLGNRKELEKPSVRNLVGFSHFSCVFPSYPELNDFASPKNGK